MGFKSEVKKLMVHVIWYFWLIAITLYLVKQQIIYQIFLILDFYSRIPLSTLHCPCGFDWIRSIDVIIWITPAVSGNSIYCRITNSRSDHGLHRKHWLCVLPVRVVANFRGGSRLLHADAETTWRSLTFWWGRNGGLSYEFRVGDDWTGETAWH